MNSSHAYIMRPLQGIMMHSCMAINMKGVNEVTTLPAFERRSKRGSETACYLPTVTKFKGKGRGCPGLSAAWDPGVSSLRAYGDTPKKELDKGYL